MGSVIDFTVEKAERTTKDEQALQEAKKLESGHKDLIPVKIGSATVYTTRPERVEEYRKHIKEY